MNALFGKIRSNPGVTLFFANVGLVIVLILVQDPFGMFKTGYAGARPLLRVSQEDAVSIEIESPDRPLLRLVRKDKLNVKKNEPAEFVWEVEQAGAKSKLTADRERVRDLFSGIEKARRYYGINRSAESEKDAEMGQDSKGRLLCMQVRITNASGKMSSLCVGKSSLRGNDSYVRLNDEDTIFLVEENLRTAFGSGDPEYFRNRRLLPEITKEEITGINASGTGKPVQITRNGSAWQMISPVPGNVNTSEMNLLLGDIIEWKAVSFPREIPKDLDRKKSLRIEIQYKQNMTDLKTASFEVLGQKDFSSYILKDADGNLFEITSLYLSHLLEPEEKLIEKSERR